MINYTLTIAAIHHETEDTVTICFKQPGLKKIKYKAGQYLTLKFNINSRKYSRAYSFSSAPGVESTLNITVKRVTGGVVSNHIVDCLSVGDVVEAVEPMGDFTLENSKITFDSHIVLWAAGSGITPIMSIVKYALQNNTVKHVTLVYGNRDLERTIFTKQISEMQQQYTNNFSVWNFHTKPFIDNNNPSIIQGRIDPEKVLNVLNNESEYNPDHTFHYICGPTGLKESVRQALTSNSVPPENIFSEEFK
ncbi:MAG: oxidoreductase, partial [Rickettsiales bacterium]